MHFIYKVFTIPRLTFPCKRGIRKKVIVFIVALMLLYLFYHSYLLVKNAYSLTFNCSFKDVEEAITSLCDSYYSNLSFGNICSSLCITGKLHPTRCINHHSGKDIVFEARWEDVDVVLKASRKNTSHYEQIYWAEPKTGKKVYPELYIFSEMLVNTIEKTLGISLDANEKVAPYLITKLWTQSYKEFVKLSPELQHNVMDNIFHLVQQPEYLLSKIYENKKVFPRILGSCGHAFIVEYYKPLDNFFSVFYPSWRRSFNQRVKLALEILNLLEKIDNQFEKPLHLCDVKMGHFGFNPEGNVRFIDLDMVYNEDTLKENLQANSCNDGDCSFIHCQSMCNQSTGFCSKNILNNNLQRICGNIFHGYTWKMTTGLLGNPPYEFAEDLNNILFACLNQNTSTPALYKTFSSKLKNILKNMVSITTSDSEELKA